MFDNILKYHHQYSSATQRELASLSLKMTTGGQKIPPQKQDTQPGKEHAMNPTPQFTCPDYKPANKLQVYISSFHSVSTLI